jgi:AcrR family transcriptional regulator
MATASLSPFTTLPKQDRSQRTFARIVAAAEALLKQRRFEDIEVDDIVRRARSSVGSFYARFSSKEALLPYLYERYDAELRTRLPEIVNAQHWVHLDLQTLCHRVVESLILQMRERRGLLRAVALYARTHPDAIGESIRRDRAVLLGGPVKLLVAPHHAISHPHRERAGAFALFVAAAVCRDKILFPESPHASTLQVDDEQLASELSSLMFAYLTMQPHS